MKRKIRYKSKKKRKYRRQKLLTMAKTLGGDTTMTAEIQMAATMVGGMETRDGDSEDSSILEEYRGTISSSVTLSQVDGIMIDGQLGN